jgi:dipeptidyl aminopeptidase/acylaminoacyl peptidase
MFCKNFKLTLSRLAFQLLPLLFFLVGLMSFGTGGSLAASQGEVPLIPRSVIFAELEKENLKISPNAKYLAYLAPDANKVSQICCVELQQLEQKRNFDLEKCIQLTEGKNTIDRYRWCFDNKHLLFLRDNDGDQNFHLYAVNRLTKEQKDLTPFDGVHCEIVALSPRFPNEVLVAINKRDKNKHDVYTIQIDSGKINLNTVNPGNVDAHYFVANLNLRVCAAVTTNADGGKTLLFRPRKQSKWQKILTASVYEEIEPLAISRDEKRIFCDTDKFSNCASLVSVDTQTHKPTIIVNDKENDINGDLINPLTGQIVAIGVLKDKRKWYAVDPRVALDLQILQKKRAASLNLLQSDLTNRFWTVAYTYDDRPTEYCLYDRVTKRLDTVFEDCPQLRNYNLAKMQPFTFKARDGMTIHGYLTLPPNAEPKVLPAVLVAHGGPDSRDRWGLNLLTQWLANRGYAVVSINYRGSVGFGKRYVQAGARQIGSKLPQDLIDGIDSLIGKGIINPNKVAIMGGSFGGYLTLYGLCFYPERFACGVDLYGPTDWLSMIKEYPVHYAALQAHIKMYLGDLKSPADRKMLTECSPLFYASQIKAPLLMAQGANDPKVRPSQSQKIYDTLKQKGIPVQYTLYKDEGHGLAKESNRLHFFAQTEAFLAEHLGGQAEPQDSATQTSAAIIMK